MSWSIRCATVLTVSLLSAPCAIRAQSAQPWSVQASFLAASQKIGDEAVNGSGFEVMVRYTPAVWSVGAGFQTSVHESGDDKITISGGFLEPRWAVDVGSDRVAPYLAGRLAILRATTQLGSEGLEVTSSGNAFGAGAGLLIRATSRINVDIGAAFVRQSFKDVEGEGRTVTFEPFTGYVAKAGFSFGFGSR